MVSAVTPIIDGEDGANHDANAQSEGVELAETTRRDGTTGMHAR